ncbi:proton-conducting transporter transmembrane domain-containing protein [Pseudothermotoga thermarum]|uniref:NADH/Ubiquinone/plastoquinone (Complex I) n=1 Tax=Pseudothermotoga thermarum DSM 5069 TaxID=688269 RepID=F7YTZ3_9THEM|nr:proton-conducting transporter membrane subunit [Pseudothermotoga thermarum]AEH51575.1 NADH/Ubiquinone/plastoquinone (complex I) [Pseudothermotoga thermarum DSM 5069]
MDDVLKWVLLILSCQALNLLTNFVHRNIRKFVKVFVSALLVFGLGFLLLQFLRFEGKVFYFDLFVLNSFRFGILLDLFSIIFLSILSIVYLLVLIRYLPQLVSDRGYSFLMDLFILFASIVVLAPNYLQLLVGMELVGIVEVFLISNGLRNKRQASNVYLYFKFADVFYITGMLILFALFDSFDFLPSFANLSANNLIAVSAAWLFLIVAAFIKAAQFPFYEWLYNSVAAPISAFIFIMIFKSGVLIILRSFPLLMAWQSFHDTTFVWRTLTWTGAVGSIVAGVHGLFQREHMKIFAFSSASQYGLIFASFGLAGLSRNPTIGVAGAVFHVLTYSFSKSALIFSYDVKALNYKVHKVLLLSTVLIFTGLPFASGTFWSKEFILELALETQNLAIFTLVLLSTILTIGYSLRIYWEYDFNRDKGKLIGFSMVLPSLILMMAAVFANKSFGYSLKKLIGYLFGFPTYQYHTLLLPILPITVYVFGIFMSVVLARKTSTLHASSVGTILNENMSLLSNMAKKVFQSVSNGFGSLESSIDGFNIGVATFVNEIFSCLRKSESKLNQSTLMFTIGLFALILFTVLLLFR